MLFYAGQGSRPEPGTPELLEQLAAYNEADAAMRRAGVLIECAPLEPTSSSTTVRVRDGETSLTDGPAAEIKEQVGGFALVECGDPPERDRRGADLTDRYEPLFRAHWWSSVAVLTGLTGDLRAAEDAVQEGIALTLRCVCGLTTAEIAAGFLVPEPTMAKRLA